MATPQTNEEWEALIEKTEKDLVVSNKSFPYPNVDSREFAKTIDHTLLKLDATPAQIDSLCEEAKKDDFATVCVRVNYVQQCLANLQDTDVKIACVIGFHEGTYDLDSKLKETKEAISAGAQELDTVLNYPDLIAKKYTTIYHELSALRAAAPAPKTTFKVIFETSQLNRSQIIAASVLANAAQFDFIKTSTGFNGQGATEENVRLMKACCDALATGGHKMKVKASGGVRSLDDALTMLRAGAERLGTSGGVAIAREGKAAAGATGPATYFRTEAVAPPSGDY